MELWNHGIISFPEDFRRIPLSSDPVFRHLSSVIRHPSSVFYLKLRYK